MCNCKNIDIGSYANTIKIKSPFSNKYIYIDKCILNEIFFLWDMKIRTKGCCCGHNITHPTVVVDNKNIDNMIRMGYKQEFYFFKKINHVFILKTNYGNK